ncbi:hypothetical protein MW887_004149 [Aspergillus wentii]|nr:hypothetical protein MW887_004149 [Aspergillus wentii]
MVRLLPSLSIFSLAAVGTALPQGPVNFPRDPDATFPPTHGTELRIHDPTIIKVGPTYYSYGVGEHMVIHEAPSMDGPWKQTGHVLDAESVIPKGDRKAPWAPTTIQLGDTFYIYYCVSVSGCRDSAIGVATSKTPGPGDWTDHGAIFESGSGPGSDQTPFNSSNAIDPAVLVESDGKGYVSFGSYWSGIWQVPLGEDLISPGDVSQANHLAYAPKAMFPGSTNPEHPECADPSGGRPVEGSFISYHAPWYYLWFSYGQCCGFDLNNLPPPGDEYHIRVGRSVSPHGPFVDKDGVDLVDGGGTTVYGSNRDVYAPGGNGVLVDEDGDKLFYHYQNKTVSITDFWDARMGWNKLEYPGGWPVAV